MKKTLHLKVFLIFLAILLMLGCSTQVYAEDTATLDTVKNVSATSTGQKLVVKWGKVEGADGYEVLFTISDTNKTWKYDWKANSMIFSSFPYGYSYKVEVTAYKNVNDTKSYGSVSKAVYFNVTNEHISDTKLTKVTGVSTKVEDQQVTLNWDSVKAAEGYKIEFTVPYYDIKWSYYVNKNSAVFYNFPYLKNYKVEIKAFNVVNNKRQFGEVSDTVYFDVKNKSLVETDPLSKVNNIKADVSGKNVVFTWDEVGGADGYKVVITEPKYKTKWTYNWVSNKMSFSNFPSGKDYKVEVTAYKNDNNTQKYGQETNAVSFSVN